MKIEYFSPRQCWRIRWIQDGKQVAKYFKTRPEAQFRASNLLPDLEEDNDS